jgi:hypothetical protein
MGFNYAGNLGGAGAPVVRRFHTNESMYVGCLVQSIGGGGQVSLADVVTNLNETTDHILGVVTGVSDGSTSYVAAVSGTAGYGDIATYSATQADVLANGISEVEVTLAIPGVTLFKAPIYKGKWGTALYEIVNTTADTDGTEVVSPVQTADIGDNVGIIYCRSGANHGEYRTITDITTVTTTVTVPFTNTIAVNDKFVQVCCLPGFCNMLSSSAADIIDGNLAGTAGHTVYYHEINLEESGKEYAVFSMWGGTAPAASAE